MTETACFSHLFNSINQPCEIGERAALETLALWIHPELNTNQIVRVVKVVKTF